MSTHEYEDGPLRQAILSGDRRTELEGMRDFIVQQLEGSRCKACSVSQLKSGEQAALLLRLQQITLEISMLPKPDKEVKGLALIRGNFADRLTGTEDQPPPKLGTKGAERRSASRRTRKPRGSGS